MANNFYVMSNIHGQFDMFLKMLEKIDFNSNDQLYILGDIIDKGDKPLECLDFVMGKENIHCLMGDHEWLLCKYINRRMRLDRSIFDVNTRNMLKHMEEEERNKYIDWMRNLPLEHELYLNNKTYYFNHALPVVIYDKNNPREIEGALFIPEGEYYKFASMTSSEDSVYIAGHNATYRIWIYEYKVRNTIWFNKNRSCIDVDCGAGFIEDGGCLGCLRLNDYKEYYIYAS